MFHSLKPRKVLRAKSEFYNKLRTGVVSGGTLFLIYYSLIKPKLKPSIFLTVDEEESNIIPSNPKAFNYIIQHVQIL
jgi:hypothetical protein